MSRHVCASHELHGRRSVRFELGIVLTRFGPAPLEGFALRTADGQARAYLNACPHRGQPVDLGDGRLFDQEGLLECQAHGAYFSPESGLCVRGACPGRSLRALELIEADGEVTLGEGALLLLESLGANALDDDGAG